MQKKRIWIAPAITTEPVSLEVTMYMPAEL